MHKQDFVFLLLLFALSHVAISQSMLKDINTTTRSTSFGFSVAVLNGTAFFGADDTNGKGNELWKTDGSSGGTTLVKDIYVGEMSSFPANFLALNGRFLFTAQDSMYSGEKIFISDGTAAGTQPLLVNNHAIVGNQYVQANGLVYFTMPKPDYNTALLRTDGTSQGTVELAVTAPNSGIIENPVVVGNLVYYITGSFDYTYTLMRTDGTPQGTVALKSITRQEGMFGLAAVGTTAYCWIDDPVEGFALWKSDGSVAGTTLLIDLEPGQYSGKPSKWVSAGNYLFFLKDSGAGTVCWRTDGSLAGTEAISQPLYGASNVFIAGSKVYVAADSLLASSFDGPLVTILNMDQGVRWVDGPSMVELNGILYFVALNVPGGNTIWRSDGTEAGTTRVWNIKPDPNNIGPYQYVKSFFTLNDHLYWVLFHPFWGAEMWATDDSGYTMNLVADMNTKTNSSDAYELKGFGSVTLFAADDGREGRELWQHFPGSNQVTTLDLNPGPSGSSPIQFTQLDNQVIFQATDSLHGSELWHYDLFTNQAALLADLQPGTAHGYPSFLSPSAGKLLFNIGYGPVYPVYMTDGTAAGTLPVPNYPDFNLSAAVLLPDEVFYATPGADLYRMNISGSGLTLLKDFDLTAGASYITSMVSFKNSIFFSAPDQAYGQELWVSDGTPAGTVLFKDFSPGPANGFPNDLTVVDSQLFFTAYNESYGVDLWVTDGTSGGTVKLSEVSAPFTNLEIGGFHNAQGLLYFLTGHDNPDHTTLWRSDGTISGTFILHEFDQSIYHTELFPMGHSIYFNGTDSLGYELWTSDGSMQGTHLVSDLCPGACNGDPVHFAASDSLLYFTAYLPEYGREPWIMKIGTSSTISPVGAQGLDMKILGNPIQSGSLIGVKLSVNQPVNTSFKLYDLTGRMVWYTIESSQAGENLYHFSLPTLAPGMYLLQATAGQERTVQKVMIAR